MTTRKYLKSILDPEQLAAFQSLKSSDPIILVTGSQMATGKSTFVEFLRQKGFTAYELTEGSIAFSTTTGRRILGFCLNTPLKHLTNNILDTLTES